LFGQRKGGVGSIERSFFCAREKNLSRTQETLTTGEERIRGKKDREKKRRKKHLITQDGAQVGGGKKERKVTFRTASKRFKKSGERLTEMGRSMC